MGDRTIARSRATRMSLSFSIEVIGAGGGGRTAAPLFPSISYRFYVAAYPKIAIFAMHHYTPLHAGAFESAAAREPEAEP
jgi:hypothetical protein